MSGVLKEYTGGSWQPIQIGAQGTSGYSGVSGFSGTSGGINTGIATLDFGSAPGSNEASIAITTETSILNTSKVEAFVMSDDTSTSHTASDHKYFPMLAGLTCGTPTTGVGFTIYARSAHKLTGTWTVRYLWTN